MKKVIWTNEHKNRWINICDKWINFKATESNPNGLKNQSNELINWLKKLGFKMKIIKDPEAPYRPIIIAKKPPKNNNKWIGFFHHYDVEMIHKDWKTNPWKLISKNNRVFGRGIADNVGPLVQRLMYFEEFDNDVGVILVIQGEEEIGSPWAHKTYSKLNFPEVLIWLDETGYFYKNGDQRLMNMGDSLLLDNIVVGLENTNTKLGIGTRIRNRYLTKAFGLENCPCIAHLLNDKPYLSIGPNDDFTKVHGPNESMDTNILPISFEHLNVVFREVENLA